MPSSSSSTSSKRKSSAASSGPDAIKLLTQDHKDVRELFKEYDKLCEDDADDEEKQAIALQACLMLTVHAQIEEEIFYPAAREAMDEQDLLDEAEVEHDSAKDLIAQIESMQPGEDLFDAKVKVLGEYVEHHVKEEEGEMFPKLKKAGLDMAGLGEALETRKQELMAELGEGQSDDDEA